MRTFNSVSFVLMFFYLADSAKTVVIDKREAPLTGRTTQTYFPALQGSSAAGFGNTFDGISNGLAGYGSGWYSGKLGGSGAESYKPTGNYLSFSMNYAVPRPPFRPSAQYGAPSFNGNFAPSQNFGLSSFGSTEDRRVFGLSGFGHPSQRYTAPSSLLSTYDNPLHHSQYYGVPSMPSSQNPAPSQSYWYSTLPSQSHGALRPPSPQYGIPSVTSFSYETPTAALPLQTYGSPTTRLYQSYGAVPSNLGETTDKLRHSYSLFVSNTYKSNSSKISNGRVANMPKSAYLVNESPEEGYSPVGNFGVEGRKSSGGGKSIAGTYTNGGSFGEGYSGVGKHFTAGLDSAPLQNYMAMAPSSGQSYTSNGEYSY